MFFQLVEAVQQENIELLGKLTAGGADVDEKDDIGNTALNMAVEMIKAATYNDVELLEKLIERGIDINWRYNDDYTVLIYAAGRGKEEVVKFLLYKGADVDLQNKKGFTALLLAALYNHVGIIRLLLDKGANINLQDLNGDTALMYFSKKGNEEAVKFLLYRGADVDLQNKKGFTALMYAAIYSYAGVIKLLLNNGVNVTLQNNQGDSALNYSHPEMPKFIIERALIIDFNIDLSEQLPNCPVLNNYWKLCKNELESAVTQRGSFTLHSLLTTRDKKIFRAERDNLIDLSNFTIYQQYLKKRIKYLEYIVEFEEIFNKIDNLAPKQEADKQTRLLPVVIQEINSFLDHRTRLNLLLACEEIKEADADNSDRIVNNFLTNER